MQTSKIARIGQIQVWVFCVGLVVIIGCIVFQPNRWTYSKDVAIDTVYASVPADEITVQATKTGMKFHRPGCRYLAKSNIPMPLLNAMNKGLTACTVCKPPQ